MSRCGSALGKP
jgi:glutaryl-CoA dehydrogenase